VAQAEYSVAGCGETGSFQRAMIAPA